jgi:Ni,Fe-hydrogenase III large subunit/Ni,Fe-hydrogenase III component G
MPLHRWFDPATPVPGAPRVRSRTVTRGEWRDVAEAIAANGGRLLALWAQGATPTPQSVMAAFAADPGVLIIGLPLTDASPEYPGLEAIFPAAGRLQRTVADLSGLRSTDPDRRPWLLHGSWGEDFHPLRDLVAPSAAPGPVPYEFVRVEGEGVHEIAVGPVHAGIIEPGHFRFSVVGEKVLRLEERLGYAHKGIERRFTQLPLTEGTRLAARISGDSAVAFSWAYCQALEGLAGVVVPPRASWLRALALELERVSNHLGDLGAIINDTGFAFGLAQFSRLKELLLRAIEPALGARYLMDFVIPGGTHADLTGAGAEALGRCLAALVPEARLLRGILEEHEGVRDRLVGAGTVSQALARRLGLTGLAGRASGQAYDLRADRPWAPYDELPVRTCTRSEGDVAARVAVRFDELFESCTLIGHILERMPGGPHRGTFPTAPPPGFGLGLIEGWRGPALIALLGGPDGAIRRCHAHDPSWENWPVLEHAIINNIVPDFPLINKSFNLSYSGHDL